MGKLKVGLVLDDSLDRTDGVQQYVKTVGNWLNEQGHDVHYLAGQTDSDKPNVHSLARNLNVRFNGNRLSVPLPSTSSDIEAVMQAQDFDVLHVQMPYSPFMAGRVIKAASDETAVVGTFHILPLGKLQKAGSKLLGWAQNGTLSRFDAVCAVSEPAKVFASQYFGVESDVLPNAIDISSWTNDSRIEAGKIVFLGRLVERKGCQQLLKAINALPSELQQKITVQIAGDGPLKPKLQAYVENSNLPVEFLGFIDEDQKASLLGSAEIAVFPALGGESFGIVLLEAMAAGAGVVIGGDNPGYASVLGGRAEALFDPNDHEQLAKNLERFLKDSAYRESLGRAQTEAVQEYDIELIGAKLVEMYRQAILHRRQEVR